MTLALSHPRARSRWSAAAMLLTTVLVLSLVIPMTVLAAPPKITLDQCRNGSAATPNQCEALGGSAGWVNGNAGASNAHFVEGHSIPYRAYVTDGPLGSNQVVLGYDVKHSGVNAIDFLTHYQRLEPHGQFGHGAGETVSPLSGLSGVGSDIAECAIPDPGNLSAAALATFNQIKNVEDKNDFTVFGANSCTVTQVATGNLADAQSEARVRVTYNATSANVVLAWGGHIARSADWNGNGAAQISGSPYHMRLKEWSAGNVGNQDRSLSAAAVLQEQSTVVTTIHAAAHGTIANGSTIALGSSVHDSATVTGFGPTGNVTFTFFRGGDCTTGTAEGAGTVALVAATATTSTAHPSDTKATLTAGNYAFRAQYAGDGSNIGSTSACEPFSVGKGTLNLSTQIHLGSDHLTNYDRNASGNGSASVAINSVVHDVAFVSGAVTGIAPTGPITFTMWSNGTCDGTGTALGTAGADEGGSGTRSVATSQLAPGDYSFKATIAEDGNYTSATSPCEALRVDKATPAIGTTPTVTPNDSTTFTSLAGTDDNDFGTVTFSLYKNDSTCAAANVVFTSPAITVTGNGDVLSTNNTTYVIDPTKEDDFYWQAVYSGDSSNNAVTTACTAEKFEIDFTVTP
jgi:hypothetical protein